MKRILIIFSLLLLSGWMKEAQAIPAFARKYNMTCQSCHSQAPKLKPYGYQFSGDGFVMPGKDSSDYFAETCDDELSLIRQLPLAIRIEGYFTYNDNNNKKNDFSNPYMLKLISGGAIGGNVSYYLDFCLSERGEVGGVKDAFFMFNNLFGSELDVILGQFQASDELFKRELRLPFEDYQIYKCRPGISSVDLTYDRGVMLKYGSRGGTDLALEVLNGSGIGSQDGSPSFDKDNYKNFLFRISQHAAQYLRLGAFAYYGNEEVKYVRNEIVMWGPDFTLEAGPFEINAQYMVRKDKNPLFFKGKELEIQTKGAFCELIFSPNGGDGKWYMAGLFNWIESEQAALNYRSLTLHSGYLLRRNIRLVSECTYNLTSQFARVSLGLFTDL